MSGRPAARRARTCSSASGSTAPSRTRSATCRSKAADLGPRRLRISSDLADLASARSFQPGDRLILYTDGIADAAAPDRERFGTDRFQRLASGTYRGTAAETCTAVISSVLEFQGNAEPADDLALLVLRRLPEV